VFYAIIATCLAAGACFNWSLPFITEQQIYPHSLPW